MLSGIEIFNFFVSDHLNYFYTSPFQKSLPLHPEFNLSELRLTLLKSAGVVFQQVNSLILSENIFLFLLDSLFCTCKFTGCSSER